MRRIHVLPVLCALAAVVAGTTSGAVKSEASATSRALAASGCASAVESLLGRMTLAEKVGQMVMVLNAPGFGDFTDTETLIREHHVGSVVSHAYFGHGPADAAARNNVLQAAAATTRLGIPILNAADFEAGVSILVADGASLPLQMGLGATRRRQDAAAAAEVTAAEARALGFQWTFSPVADVVTTALNGEGGVRTFGGDTRAVAGLVEAQVGALQGAGLAATAKHFPGMGGSEVNSHFDLPRVAYGRGTLERVHLPPFRAAVRAGVDAIMTGHIVVEALDPDRPASLSPNVTTGLLRRELGYDGVIVTDSMTLGALVTRWGIDEAAVMAVEAGADIVMEIGPTEVPLLAIEAILGAVEEGVISDARIDASVRRVLNLKCKYGLLEHAPAADPGEAESVVGAPAHLATGKELSRRAVTLVRNDGLLPFDTDGGETTLVVGVTHEATVIPTPPLSHVPQLAAAVERLSDGDVVTSEAATEDPTDEEIATTVQLAAQADRILVATYSAGPLPAGQRRLVEALLTTGKPVVAVATGTPYDLAAYPGVRAYVAAYALTFLPTYAFSSAALDAAVEVVFGANPGGRLPVPISELYPIGHGLGY